jgi:hypothetical protein
VGSLLSTGSAFLFLLSVVCRVHMLEWIHEPLSFTSVFVMQYLCSPLYGWVLRHNYFSFCTWDMSRYMQEQLFLHLAYHHVTHKDFCSHFQFLKKLNRQERVVEEVKLSLKPHYTKKHITKEEYKDILRRSVPKVSVITLLHCMHWVPGNFFPKHFKFHHYCMWCVQIIRCE